MRIRQKTEAKSSKRAVSPFGKTSSKSFLGGKLVICGIARAR